MVLFIEILLVLVGVFITVQGVGVCVRTHSGGAIAAVWMLVLSVLFFSGVQLRTVEVETLLDAESLTFILVVLPSLLALDITKHLEGVCEIFFVVHQGVGIPGRKEVLVIVKAELTDQVSVLG